MLRNDIILRWSELRLNISSTPRDASDIFTVVGFDQVSFEYQKHRKVYWKIQNADHHYKTASEFSVTSKSQKFLNFLQGALDWNDLTRIWIW